MTTLRVRHSRHIAENNKTNVIIHLYSWQIQNGSNEYMGCHR